MDVTNPVGSTTDRNTFTGIFNLAMIDMSFRITCAEYFYGPNCKTFCRENCNCLGVRCGVNQVCESTVSSYTCVCEPGYTGQDCSTVVPTTPTTAATPITITTPTTSMTATTDHAASNSEPTVIATAASEGPTQEVAATRKTDVSEQTTESDSINQVSNVTNIVSAPMVEIITPVLVLGFGLIITMTVITAFICYRRNRLRALQYDASSPKALPTQSAESNIYDRLNSVLKERETDENSVHSYNMLDRQNNMDGSMVYCSAYAETGRDTGLPEKLTENIAYNIVEKEAKERDSEESHEYSFIS